MFQNVAYRPTVYKAGVQTADWQLFKQRKVQCEALSRAQSFLLESLNFQEAVPWCNG